MEFGLWVEPEMVNPDSDLFRAYPDWVLSGSGGPGRLPQPWRNQQVLDLAIPDCYSYLRDRLDALLGEHDIDLGILARSDRVWASDTNDALERQPIQRWTQLPVPPELVGSHVGPPRSHTTGRVHDPAFRVATALFGHFGIEWDIASASAGEQEALAEAIAFYRRMRPLLHGGQVVRADHPDPAAYLHGVVAADRAEALFAYVQLTASAFETPGLARLPGLDPDRAYRVEPVAVAGEPETKQAIAPAWLEAGGVTLGGRSLAEVGLPVPVLRPEQALLLHVRGA